MFKSSSILSPTSLQPSPQREKRTERTEQEQRTFITVRTKPPDLAHRCMLTDKEKTEDWNSLKASPWTGLLRPGRNRWWRRSRPPTERPILYTGGQRHGQISSMETRWTGNNGIWPLQKKMAGWINVLLSKVKSVDSALPHTLSHMIMHLYTHTHTPHALYAQGLHKQICMQDLTFF